MKNQFADYFFETGSIEDYLAYKCTKSTSEQDGLHEMNYR